MLEHQGRDPVHFFGQHGIPRNEVLLDAIRVAASPIRYGQGALPEVFPQTPPAAPGESAVRLELYHNVSIVVPIRQPGREWVGLLPIHGGTGTPVPLYPFLGLMGVAANTRSPVPSVAPSTYGGTLDIQDLTAGSTLYLPVEVPAPLFYVSDSHFSRGSGAVDLTANEGSLRAPVRRTVIRRGTPGAPFGHRLRAPFAESASGSFTIGLSPELNEVMRGAVSHGVEFLVDRFDVTPTEAYAYLSIGANFYGSEVADATKGLHGVILKSDFATVPRAVPGRRGLPMERTVPIDKSRTSPSVSPRSSTN